MLSSDAITAMRPRLTEDHYEQLSIPKVATLGYLVDQIERGFSGNDPERSVPTPSRLSPTEAMKVLKENLDVKNIGTTIGSLIPFSPFERGKGGEAPRAAYAKITQLLIVHSVLSDLLDVFGIELNAKRSAPLFERLLEKPVDRWQKDPVLAKLLDLSQQIARDPSLTQYVSRLEAFSKYALYENPSEQLRLANAAKAVVVAPIARSLDTGVAEQEKLLSPSPTNPVDQLMGSIQALLDAHEIGPEETKINSLYIARLAARRHFSFEKLKRIMESCDFENASILEALHGSAR
jgi:hypothetical protein